QQSAVEAFADNPADAIAGGREARQAGELNDVSVRVETLQARREFARIGKIAEHIVFDDRNLSFAGGAHNTAHGIFAVGDAGRVVIHWHQQTGRHFVVFKQVRELVGVDAISGM